MTGVENGCRPAKGERSEMLDTNFYRDKYRKQPDRRGHPMYRQGGEDVYQLCDAVDFLTSMIRKVQPFLNEDLQHEIERELGWRF